jgi:osmoprotectant transport system permease protein
MDMAWTEFLVDRLPELWSQTGRHLMLTGTATCIAVLVGLPLGILCSRVRAMRGPALGAIGILQTVPSLAMLALLLLLTGKIGARPAIIALVLYALLPIVRNAVTGLESVPDYLIEAGRGVGMTDAQRLLRVELPLALPMIVAGIRTAAVIGVGITTLSTYIGAGGLGDFIKRGLAMWHVGLIVLGVVPAIMLALLVDFAIWCVEWSLRPIQSRQRTPVGKTLRLAARVAPVLLIGLGLATALSQPFAESRDAAAAEGQRVGAVGVIRIGSKEFAEQLLLGEMMAQMIEARTNLTVDRTFGLGGTMICHEALAVAELDLYAEYTGTGYRTILKKQKIVGPYSTYAAVAAGYRAGHGAEWLEPFGFNNTYAITVRQADADEHGWKTISDLASTAGEMRAGFTSEFQERQDGYPGLRRAYGFRFGSDTDMDSSLMCEALDKGEVDVICAFATDGRIAAYELKVLKDDRGFFPPYDAAPVVRTAFLNKHPEVRDALAALAGLLDDATMQRLNYEVEGNKRQPAEVAREFLVRKKLIRAPKSDGD